MSGATWNEVAEALDRAEARNTAGAVAFLLPHAGPLGLRLAEDLGGAQEQWDTVVVYYTLDHDAEEPTEDEIEIAIRAWWAEDQFGHEASPLNRGPGLGSFSGQEVRGALLVLLRDGWKLSRVLAAALYVEVGP